MRPARGRDLEQFLDSREIAAGAPGGNSAAE